MSNKNTFPCDSNRVNHDSCPHYVDKKFRLCDDCLGDRRPEGKKSWKYWRDKFKNMKPKQLVTKDMIDNTYYTDASTLKNGQEGQNSSICITDNLGIPHFKKNIGDYTINEAEVLAILACFKHVAPEQKIRVLTDSKLAVHWINSKFNKKSKASKRTKAFVSKIRNYKLKTNSIVAWVPRDKNKAGIYIEEEGLLYQQPESLEENVKHFVA